MPGGDTNGTAAAAAGPAEQPLVPAEASPAAAVVERLRSEDAPPTEWRREALARYTAGRVAECQQILEASSEFRDRLVTQEQTENMYLLVDLYVSRALEEHARAPAAAEALLGQARATLERAEGCDLIVGTILGADAFAAKGFNAVVRHVLRCGCEGDELKRAETFFDAALKVSPTAPRALLGKAVVFAEHKEWAKALSLFRQVLRRAAPPAPRSGRRLDCLKHLRFAIATCFCSLGRFEQLRHALEGVVAADAGDVEALCGLANLEAKVSEDGAGRSLELLGEAARADQQHPVVLCLLANHAFYCGLEEGGVDGAGRSADENGGAMPAPWRQAAGLLQKALAVARAAKVRAEVHFQLGRLEHAQGRFEAAQGEYRRCCEASPEHFVCSFNLAKVCLQLKLFPEAVERLEALRRSRGDLPEVLKLLAFAYLLNGDRGEDAAKCTEALVAKEEDDLQAWALQAEARDQVSMQQPKLAAEGLEVYEHMAELLGNGDEGLQAAASPQMWNNLGTLRGLKGDPGGARTAFSKGLELAERLLAGENRNGPSDAEQAKDLQVAKLTIRFNSAWLAETLGESPNYMQATQEYMSINEEHSWYADSLLQLGQQWERMGEPDLADERYKEAIRHHPVAAALMQAELHRAQGNFMKALQSGELAVTCATEKRGTFHYAHVYLGNLYFEVARDPATREKERDAYLMKALKNYTKALQQKKDSHYAANGIGMVFAQKGNINMARRTFQSVVQHHGMGADPAVFINLAHTYLQDGGENARKAIALYEQARKMQPDDLKIRLFLARAHFRLKDFERCLGVLGDATQIWPDDLLLRFNTAMALESFGASLVSEEKRTKRIVGHNDGIQRMSHAMQLLSSAARIFEFVYTQWMGLSDGERRAIASRAGGDGGVVVDGMLSASQHKEYCVDMEGKAGEALAELKTRRLELDRQIQENAKLEAEKKRSEAAKKKPEKDQDAEEEMEENLRELQEKARTIDLGKNLEKAPDKKMPKLKDARKHIQMAEAGGDGAPEGDLPEAADRERGRSRKRKEKTGKKEKKRHKRRRRGHETDDVATTEPRMEDLFGDEDPAPAEEGTEAAPGSSGGRRHKKKKSKKHGKDKHKKKKHRHGDSPEMSDGAMEEELFGGPDDQEDLDKMETELFGDD